MDMACCDLQCRINASMCSVQRTCTSLRMPRPLPPSWASTRSTQGSRSCTGRRPASTSCSTTTSKAVTTQVTKQNQHHDIHYQTSQLPHHSLYTHGACPYHDFHQHLVSSILSNGLKTVIEPFRAVARLDSAGRADGGTCKWCAGHWSTLPVSGAWRRQGPQLK